MFATGQVDLGAPVLGVDIGDEVLIEDGVVNANFGGGGVVDAVVLVQTDTNAGNSILIEWLEPFGWYAFHIAAVDTPTMIIYEFIYLGLQFLWDELRFVVNDMALEHFEEIRKEDQRTDIASVGEVNSVPQEETAVNTVPEDNEPVTPNRPSPRPTPPRPRPRPSGGDSGTDGTTVALEEEFDNDEM